MQKEAIYFDLDDTLWQASKEGVTAEMWNRLPAAMNARFLGKTSEIEWDKHKGSTDFALLYSIMQTAPLEEIQRRDRITIVRDVMSLMWAYYVRMSPESIRDAVFSETEEVLQQLSATYKFGVVSGNDGTEWYGQKSVGEHKLIQAGLNNYFPDLTMKFWGGDHVNYRRQDLLLRAHMKNLSDSFGESTPLRYIADSNGDFDGVWGMVKDYPKPIDVHFGWITRSRGAMTRAMTHIVDTHKLKPEIDFDYFDRYGYYDAGAIFRLNTSREDQTLTVHLAPTLKALTNPGGLLY